MSRKERRAARGERLRGLLDAGDHGAARLEARALLAEDGAPAEDRAAAAEMLASLAPERAAVLAGAAGVVAAVVLSALVLLRG